MISAPQKIEIVGDFLAMNWGGSEEIVLDSSTLRKNSPSAEQAGERDIFGRLYGGSKKNDFSEVKLKSYEKVGNYALRLIFSDGHSSGLYSWEYFKNLSKLTN